MIVVFWLEGPRAQHRDFSPDQLAQALQFAEALRRRRREGEPISHVAIQSEPVESVGQAGVSDAPPDYAHYKRRLDPSVPLGRPSAGACDPVDAPAWSADDSSAPVDSGPP